MTVDMWIMTLALLQNFSIDLQLFAQIKLLVLRRRCSDSHNDKSGLWTHTLSWSTAKQEDQLLPVPDSRDSSAKETRTWNDVSVTHIVCSASRSGRAQLHHNMFLRNKKEARARWSRDALTVVTAAAAAASKWSGESPAVLTHPVLHPERRRHFKGLW